MKNIAILKMVFPNDPTHNISPHQMYVSVDTKKSIEFYSVSSILGKESRVYGPEKDNYCTIIGEKQLKNGFKSPSFIDCAKSYVVDNPQANYDKLSGRNIDDDLKIDILQTINNCKKRGVHTTYYIQESELKRWNEKL